MHAAIAQQSDEMQLPLAATLHGLLKQRHAFQFLVRHQQVYAGDVHVHDAPGADIHVAHFAVAHLAFGQSHERAGSVNQRVGKFAQQLVVSRLARQRDGVALRFRAVSPAIQYRQHDWFRFFIHSASEYTDSQRSCS